MLVSRNTYSGVRPGTGQLIEMKALHPSKANIGRWSSSCPAFVSSFKFQSLKNEHELVDFIGVSFEKSIQSVVMLCCGESGSIFQPRAILTSEIVRQIQAIRRLKKEICRTSVMCIRPDVINSRTAIAGPLLAISWFFTIQWIWIVLGRCVFTTRRGVLEKWFLKREMKRVKKFEVILVVNKSEERSEKRVVLFIPLFLRERKIDVWKNFVWASEFFCSRAAFKSSFLQLLMVMRFGYDIGLVLGFFW